LPDTAPACVHDEGSRRLVLSGLNHTTFDLTVYASQDGLPHHHARIASGCWSSFARRDSYTESFSERFQSSSVTEQEISAIPVHLESAANDVYFLVSFLQIVVELSTSLSRSSRSSGNSGSPSSFRS